MNTKTIGLLVAVVLLAGGAGAYIYAKQAPASTSVSNASDTAVRSFVTEFASKFKNVSLLADNKSAQMTTEYSAYVSPELLFKWQSNAEDAPGRQTSSPWPDRITIVSVTENTPNIFTVEGNVIEVTSADATNTPAAVQPVTLTVEKRGEAFVVTAFSKGSYSELPKQVTIAGTWECLPHKNASGPQTMECAFGIKGDDGKHYAISTSLMSQYPVDFPTGAKVRVQGVLVPVEQLNSVQKYDIAGVINATTITKSTSTSGGKLMSIDSYVTQNISTLSTVKASLGGTFYVTSLEAANGKGVVHYEDGHNAYIADFTYTVSDTATGAGNIQVTSFIVR